MKTEYIISTDFHIIPTPDFQDSLQERALLLGIFTYQTVTKIK